MSKGHLRPDPEWFATVRVGDVLLSGSGDFRVVRRVSRRGPTWRRRGLRLDRGKPDELIGVTFAIRRCSRYHQPYTTYTASDLKTLGYTHTGVRVRLRSTLDKKLARYLERRDGRPKMDCCTVRGLP